MLLDVIYALIAFHMLSYLPPAENMSWVGKPLGLLGMLAGHAVELWRVVMGLGITAICWYLSAKRLSQLCLTDFVHTTAILIQTLFVCFFVYFAICDPMLVGGPSSRALQSGSLALASVAGQIGWAHARKRHFVDAALPKQLDDIDRSGRTEIATAVLNTPLAWVGPISWTLGWLFIPVAITLALPRLRRTGRGFRGPLHP